VHKLFSDFMLLFSFFSSIIFEFSTFKENVCANNFFALPIPNVPYFYKIVWFEVNIFAFRDLIYFGNFLEKVLDLYLSFLYFLYIFFRRCFSNYLSKSAGSELLLEISFEFFFFSWLKSEFSSLDLELL